MDYEEMLNGYLDEKAAEWTKLANKVKEWADLHEDKLALCIGAGVTQAFVGTWDELLNEIAVLRVSDTLSEIYKKTDCEADLDLKGLETYIKNHFSGKCDGKKCRHKDSNNCRYLDEETKKCRLHNENSFFPKGMNVLEQGEYLMDDKNDISFPIDSNVEEEWRELFFSAQVKYVLNKLISEKTNCTQNIGERVDATFIGSYFIESKDIDKKVGTLREVLRICLAGDVQHVITYNFDTVLEDLLTNDAVCNALAFNPENCPSIEVYTYNDKRIEELSKKRPNEEKTIRIYHVHGIAYEDEVTPLDRIIFSEHSYSDYQRDILNWSNLRIASVLSTHCLLCVGFSGTDANFRFLTRNMANMKKRREFSNSNAKLLKVWLTRAFESTFLESSMNGNINAYACFKTYTDSFEYYFKNNFGINILWAENFVKMADKLKYFANKLQKL